MVLLVERLSRSLRFPSKLDNRHHNSEALSASLEGFRSVISNSVNQLLLNSGPGLDILSLERVQQFLELLSLINNKAFPSLVVSIDYPISKWEAATVEEYLKYSLNCLELLNCVSSCLSHLSQDRLSLSHALSLVEDSCSLATRNLKRIQPKDPGKHFKVDGLKGSEERHFSGKEWVIHQALLVMKSIALWVFGIVLSGLSSDVKPYSEMRKLAGRFDDSLVQSMDSKVVKEIMEKQGELKEVKDVNDAADGLVKAMTTRNVSIAAKELKRRLETLEKLLQGVEKETDDLFAEILAARNKLLDSFRHTSRSNTD